MKIIKVKGDKEFTEEIKDCATRLVGAHVSIRKLAEEVGRTEQVLWKLLREHYPEITEEKGKMTWIFDWHVMELRNPML